ncbi:AMP-binding protein [Pendulispora albinea]|uniref:AMP-binding protein n=1 Tax=Pendulispora albinea TaxID=2741071 RepID=A0ABZ2MB32_9BACT
MRARDPGDMVSASFASSVSGPADVLQWRARYSGDARAYTFLDGGAPGSERHITYSELDRLVRGVAVALSKFDVVGERVIVLAHPGLSFIAAFLGCLYAGATAVPAFPPRPGTHFDRFVGILRDARVKVVLAEDHVEKAVRKGKMLPADFDDLPWVCFEACAPVHASEWRALPSKAGALAMLQYTSGSTGSPKGVMVTNENLLHNVEMIRAASGQKFDEGCGAMWLPPYHDMGLIGGILHTIYVGMPTVIMSPTLFLRRPLVWLETITKYRVTNSGGPNFAYDFCVSKTTSEQRAKLDLSSWEVAFCGAEPVRAETLDAFARAFEPAGFRRTAFLPCYGLAEATLMVSGGPRATGGRILRVDAEALGKNRIVRSEARGAARLVGSGEVAPGAIVKIVDPATRRVLEDDRVGEIWTSGPSVARGYFGLESESQMVFEQAIDGDPSGERYLRTGDLGFLREGELFVTGRVKDVLIIHGVNHYPQDIEGTVQAVSPKLRAGRGVVFSLERDAEERLVIVQEVEGETEDPTPLLHSIRDAVADEHGVPPHTILLVGRNSIPLTSSGKLQRRDTKQAFLDRSLPAVATWTRPLTKRQNSLPADTAPHTWLADDTLAPDVEPNLDLADPASIEAWIIHQFVDKLGIPRTDIDPERSFAQLGLDSVTALAFISELEERIGYVLGSELFYEQPTIRMLARELARGRELTPRAPTR